MNSLQALGNLASNFCKKSKTLFFTVIVAYIAYHIEKRIFQIVCVISEKIMKNLLQTYCSSPEILAVYNFSEIEITFPILP